jgi:outer membrane receptor protein involved in Fe transport
MLAIESEAGVGQAQFFVNSIDTRTQGVDLTASWRGQLAGNPLAAFLGVNYSKTEVRKVNTPESLAGFEDVLLSERERLFIEQGGPRHKAVLGFVQQAAGSTPEDTRTFNTFLPKGGLRYEFNDDLSASFIVQRGYRSGGSTFNIARSDAYSFNPEYTWNYEASVRSLWLDGALAINANLYYIDWKDKQVTAFFGLNDYDYHTVNAGRAHLYGFEVEATHRLSEGFDWYGSLGYSRTQYDEFSTVIDAQINDYAGTEFAYAPHWTLSLGANWRFADRWVANLNASYRDQLYPDIGQSQSLLGARTLVNAKLGYENMDWSAYVFANNLMDEEYIQYWWGEERPSVILGAPRVVGIGFEARW